MFRPLVAFGNENLQTLNWIGWVRIKDTVYLKISTSGGEVNLKIWGAPSYLSLCSSQSEACSIKNTRLIPSPTSQSTAICISPQNLFDGPPLWCSDQSSCLQIQRSGLDSRRYQIFWEVVGLERGPLSLMSTVEELLGRKSRGSCLERREYGRRDPSRWLRDTLYPQ
jgi:hypothetical protein